MPLDTPETINIRSLVIEAPEKSWNLDPIRLLTDEDWDGIKQEFESRTNIILKSSFISKIKLLSPERLSIFDLSGILPEIKRNLEVFKSSFGGTHLSDTFNRLGYYSLISDSRFIFGKRAIELDIGREEKDTFKKDIREIGGMFSMVEPSFYFRMVNPEEPIESYFREHDWQIVKGQIKGVKESGNLFLMSRYAALARILFPDRFSELSISQKDLKDIYQGALSYKNEKIWPEFIQTAWALKILTADEVRVTDEGIQLINNPKSISEMESLPVVRRF